MEILFEILPTQLRTLFAAVPVENLNEIRLRSGGPVIVSISGKNFYLTPTGLSEQHNTAVHVSHSDLETILHKASNYSIYAVNEQLKQSFLTIRGGIRIGIAGEVVTEKGEVLTLKNIQALNIRVPHEIRGCSYCVLDYIFVNPRPLKTLIISPPGGGKTTFLRDLARQISDKYYLLNTLVLDERGEIAATYLGQSQLDVGGQTDVLSGSSKLYGFENGIRSMRPDVIITDEVATRSDIEMIKQAARSGVSIIASVHASGIEEIRTKPNFREVIEEGIFDRYIVLGTGENLGKVQGVWDKALRLIAG